MTRLCVVVNDVGGVPHTLHENVVSRNAAWSASSHVRLPLPSADRAEGFRRVSHGTASESIFSVVAARGVATAFAGPSCGARRLPERRSLSDPEAALAHVGVQRCSPYDDDAYAGRSDVYDVDTLRYASDAVADHHRDREGERSASPLLLWVNLLALRDVDHVRATSAAASGRGGGRVDRRSYPESLHSLVPRVTEAVAKAFYEGDAPALPQPVVRHAEAEFSALLEHSIAALERHMERVHRFLLGVLERVPDAHVCHTASHSLALGEHGMRGGATPMSITCTTFASSRPATEATQNLDAMISNFVLDAFQLAHPRDAGLPVTRVPSLGLTRTLVTHHDHTYAVIERDGALQAVFDLSTDPFELENVLGAVGHLRPSLQQHQQQRAAPPRERERETEREEEGVRDASPSPQPPPPPPRRPAPVLVPSPLPSSSRATVRPASAARRRSAPPAPPSSQNVRRIEQRLNKMHR